jgi:hypothetical protein
MLKHKDKKETKAFNKFSKKDQLKIIEKSGIPNLEAERQRQFLLEDRYGGPEIDTKTFKIIEY